MALVNKNVNCPCGMPDEDDKWMVQCNSCKTWFHGRCSQESANSVSKQPKWFCRWCRVFNKKCDEIHSIMAKVNCDINQLKESVTKGSTVMNQSEKTCSTEEVSNLKKELSEIKEERDRLSARCQSLENNNSEVTRLNQSIEAYESKVSSLQNQLREITEERDHLSARCESLQNNNSDVTRFNKSIEAYVSKVSYLQNELNGIMKERDVLSAQCKSLQEGNKELKEEMRKMNKRKLSYSQQTRK